MGEYRSHAHSISSCKYHFVWCPKYRHEVLELVRDELAELFQGTAEIAKQFKGYPGRTVLKSHPELKQRYFWGSGLWKDGYYVGTTGEVSENVVRRYIEDTEH